MRNIIILGPPGSGKGTQAKKLAEKLKMSYFGTGDLIRDEINKETELGKKIKAVVEKGQLINDEAIGQIVKNNINSFKDGGIIFDGFPRSLDQAHVLEDVLPDEEFLVINIQVSAKSLLERMEKRRICSKCDKIFIIDNDAKNNCDACGGELIRRSDDNPEVLKNRIQIYETQTAPIIDYYKQQGNVININGEPSIQEVEQEIWEKINGKIWA